MIRCSTIAELANVGNPLHLAMGVFDGLHLGHQEVIKAAVNGAESSGGMSKSLLKLVAPGPSKPTLPLSTA